MRERYYLTVHGLPEATVTKAEFVRAERAAGFTNIFAPLQPDEPATAGFAKGTVRGRVEFVPVDADHCVLEVGVYGDESTDTVRADLPEDGSELFLMVRARVGRIEIAKCPSDWWGANQLLNGG